MDRPSIQPPFVGESRFRLVDGLLAVLTEVETRCETRWVSLESPSGWGKLSGPHQGSIGDAQDTDTALAQAPDDGLGDMLVGVEPDLSHPPPRQASGTAVRACAPSSPQQRFRDLQRSARSRPDNQSSRPAPREPQQA